MTRKRFLSILLIFAIMISMMPGVSITAAAAAYSVGGTVTLSSATVEGLQVDIYASSDLSAPLESYMTDSSGGYNFSLDTGDYTLVIPASESGGYNRIIQTVTVSDADVTSDVTLSAYENTWTNYYSLEAPAYDSGSSTYTITTPEELAWVAYQCNSGNDFYNLIPYKTIELANTVDLSAHNWVPIGTSSTPFYGNFDGNSDLGYEIDGLTISDSINDLVGLFGCLAGKLKDVDLENASAQSTKNSSNVRVGALVGKSSNNYASITNCSVSGTVTCVRGYAGGLVGAAEFYSTVTGSSSSASVTGTSSNAGGFAGYIVQSTIRECYSTGSAETTAGSAAVGGFVGTIGGGSTVEKCWSAGNVKGTTYTGGFVGGLTNTTISNCYTTSNVTGGINWDAGGFVANNSYGTINYSYAVGIVGGGTFMGGLVGSNTSGVYNSCYWDSTVNTGVSTDSYASTTSVMATSDFAAALNTAGSSTNWAYLAGANGGYPILRGVGYDPCTVTYYYNLTDTTTEHTTQNVLQGSVFSAPTAPSETGYIFTGWYTDSSCTVKWDFDSDTTSLSSLSLFAGWSAVYSVGGYVSDGTGTGLTVSGLTVNLYAADDTDYSDSLGSSTTDLSGNYTISTKVPAGSYIVVIAGVSGSYATATATVTITDADLTDADLTLSEPSDNWTDYASAPTLNGSTYTITSPAELAWLASQVNGGNTFSGYTFTVANDINLSGHYWIPIGDSDSRYFAGTFDGNGHTITGLIISATGSAYTGLFGYLYGTVRDLGVTDVDITVDNTSLSSNGFVGALAGYANDITISGCWSTGSISYTDPGVSSIFGSVGGLIGYSLGCDVSNCYSAVSINCLTASSFRCIYAGGLIGYSDVCTVSNCYAAGSILGMASGAGGLCGYNYFGEFNYSYSATTLSGITNCMFTGGFIGYGSGVDYTSFTGCYWLSGTVSYGIGSASSDKAAPVTASVLAKYFDYPLNSSQANPPWITIFGVNSNYPVLDGIGAGNHAGCYFVEFVDGSDSSTLYTAYALPGQDIPAPADPIKSYYIFKGWYDSPSSGSTVSFPVRITADTSIFAQWDASTYAISITAPTDITNVANGTAKTASALGLPEKVTLTTSDGDVQADVIWDVDSSSYDPSVTTEQTFTVNGTVTLPGGVVNPDGISLDVSISVTVNAAPSTDKTLVSITAPADITGVANGAAKTAFALGLPEKVTLVTDAGNVQADATWDVDSSSYDPSDTAEQTFTVDGTVTLPNGVVNPDGISLDVSIDVTVNAVSSVDKILVSIATSSSITGVANGTGKSASALGLPTKVTLATDGGDVQADVIWDVDGCSYDPDDTAEQTFRVNGTVILPSGVVNPNGVPLATSIIVTVSAGNPASFMIIASAGNGGGISPSGEVPVTEGGSRTFTITPNANYTIASVRVDGINEGAISSYTFTNVTAGHTIHATFSRTGGGGGGSRPAYIPRTLTDNATGITVSGNGIPGSAVLTVEDMELHPKGTCAACAAIRQQMGDGDHTLLLGWDISLSGAFTGTLDITVPVDSRYNGLIITMLHCKNGVLETLTATVIDGKAIFTVTSLSPLAVFAYVPDVLDFVPKTGDSRPSLAGWLLCGVSAAGIIALTILGKRRKPH